MQTLQRTTTLQNPRGIRENNVSEPALLFTVTKVQHESRRSVLTVLLVPTAIQRGGTVLQDSWSCICFKPKLMCLINAGRQFHYKACLIFMTDFSKDCGLFVWLWFNYSESALLCACVRVRNKL